jgi:hypothetical protein
MSSYNRPIEPFEQVLYDHFLQWVDREPPAALIQRFKALFIDGEPYGDREVAKALEQIVCSYCADAEFRFVMNRCCHILINRWQARSPSQGAVLDLIGLFDQVPEPGGLFRSRSVRRLQDLVLDFTATEQCVTLRRLARVLGEQLEGNRSGHQELGMLIPRYPYLYTHCLLNEDSVSEQKLTVQKLQADRQRQFEVDLSRYVTSMVRRSPSGAASHRPSLPQNNPTLLSDRDLGGALKQYIGRVDGTHTYRDMAQSFLAHSQHTPSYRVFKNDLFEYITATIDSDYGSRQFSNQLYQQLRTASPENDDRRLSDFLVVRTCSQLLNFLVVESPQNPRHFVFMDLIANLGPILTAGLLLKIVLICRKVKPYLERRLSILFNHYESCEQATVQWLVQVLESMNLALCLHFGNIDLSFIR